MAEANISGSGGPGRTRKWFCYKCNHEIGNVGDDYKCPQCKDTFIEEIDEANSSNPGGNLSQNASDFSFGGTAEFGRGSGQQVDLLQFLRGLSEPDGGGGGFRSTAGPHGQVRFTQAAPNYRRSRSEGAGPQGANFSFLLDPYPTQGAGGGTGGNPDHPVENMLFSFLNDLITGLGGAPMGGAPVVSNIGDYVWGRDGFDAIVTQLMNQMEGTGPAPLAEDKIDNLPDVKISQEHVDRKLQCSVCWDDFAVNDQVKQLECEHMYHPDCIIPWLKLHGTCPICRKDLNGEDPNTDTSASPSARFEAADGHSSSSAASADTTNSASHSDNSNSDNPSSNRSGANNSSEMFGPAGLANILLNQILPGAMGLNRPQQNSPEANSAPNTGSSGHQGHQRDRNQRRDGDGQGGNSRSRGFDYMDEFD